MLAAAIQTVSSSRVDENLRAARALLQQAADAGAELAVLPEYFCLMGLRDTDKIAHGEAFGQGPIQDWLAETALTLKLWIVGGTLPLQAQDPALRSSHVRNSTLVYAPDGLCMARYDKIHLFRINSGSEQFDEARVLERGQIPTYFDLPSRDGHRWRIGLSICYDLRFPELYRHHAAQGADMLVVPSAFTYATGQAHWELLLRARAVENLCPVIAAAQGGVHENGRRTWGHTMLIDAWGQVLAMQAQGPAIALAELSAPHTQEMRQRLPALSHRLL